MFLRRIFALWHRSSPRSRQPGIRRSRGERLRLESLESRALLSVSPHPAITAATDTATHYEVIAPEQANDAVPATFEVVALDAADQPVLSYNGTASVAITGATTSSAPTTITFHHGFDFFQATFSSTGTATVAATDTTTSSITGSAASDVNAAPVATQFLLTMPGKETPGKPVNVTVEALDASGHIVPNYTGTIQLTSSTDTSNTTLPITYQFTSADAGKHTFQVTFSTATGSGLQSLTATDTTTASITGSVSTNITRPAAATHFELILPENVAAGVATEVRVIALNANNQPVPNYTGTVSFSSTSDPTATLPGSYTFTSSHRWGDNGEHTFQATFDTTGTQSLTVTDTANSLSATASTNVVPAPAATHLEVIVPENTPIGTAVPVVVLALDASNHVVKDYSGTVTLTTTPTGGVTITGPTTPNSSDTGIERFKITATDTGALVVTATDGNGLTGSATTNVVAAASSSHGLGSIWFGVDFAVAASLGKQDVALDGFGHGHGFRF